ncbi:hypothetical protein EI546_03270 [Aequorivita sp. H23M31]|uniref:Uncharacterized protein n=1 Tax=Aequorivita ciconiae TaxID=2494375 RepID=A0A410G0K8_9FLAO|nr:hypothetical protein [Aequorivita sp. H23M31]QAA80807.1 hypothetical protein EI546_03270 [Aequorivita sp. H23M31]
MRFLLSEYISLLKEDGELDTLITDLLVGMKITPLSKPEKGRQHGVDIAAVGIDPADNIKKVFLIAVKQGNLTRSNWDSGVNSVRPTLNEIKDTYLNVILDKKLKELPKKIVVCTNGEIVQNVQINWSSYINENSEDNLEYTFWGIGKISEMLDVYLDNEKLFPLEYQSNLRKTLAFLDLPDYDLSHFYELIGKILQKEEKQKQKILRQQRLVRLCLNIIYKWSEEIDNLKPALLASERCMLLSWDWLQKGKHLDKKFARSEFYKLHSLKRTIGINYFNKVNTHYTTPHSLYKYSKNNLEYTFSVWEEIGFLSTIGLTEIQEFQIHHREGNKEHAKTYLRGAYSIANALSALILQNPPSSYPVYDEFNIEVALALNFLIKMGNTDVAKTWINNLGVGIHDNFVLNGFFPLFLTNFDKLVDVENGDDVCDIDSSMLLTILIEYSVVLNEAPLYNALREIIKDQFPNLNLQIWFATEETEYLFCRKNYDRDTGTVKHSIEVYEKMEDYHSELIEEIELFGPENKFSIFTEGFDIMGHLASRHYRAQPFPIYWRSLIKSK